MSAKLDRLRIDYIGELLQIDKEEDAVEELQHLLVDALDVVEQTTPWEERVMRAIDRLKGSKDPFVALTQSMVVALEKVTSEKSSTADIREWIDYLNEWVATAKRRLGEAGEEVPSE